MMITSYFPSTSGTPSTAGYLFTEKVQAGFPSPAQDYAEQSLDLNQWCVTHPQATFFLKVAGNSMIDAGIFEEDILIVDRSLQAEHLDIVVAHIDGGFTVKTLLLHPHAVLAPANSQYAAIPITEDTPLEIFGVVTGVVRKLTRRKRSHARRNHP